MAAQEVRKEILLSVFYTAQWKETHIKTYRQYYTFVDCWKAFAHPAAAASELNPQLAVSWDHWIWKCVSAETACQSTWKTKTKLSVSNNPAVLSAENTTQQVWQVSGWHSEEREEVCCESQLKTFQRSFSPEPVSDLHVVVPAQVTPEEVHRGEVQNNLRDRRQRWRAGRYEKKSSIRI